MSTEINTIVRKGNKAVVYNDDGIFCSWTDIKEFNFNLIAEVKAKAGNNFVMLVTEEEMEQFIGEHIDFDDHHKWTISRDLIWVLEGRCEATKKEKPVIEFMKSLMI